MPSVMKMAKCPTFRCGAPSDLLGGLDFTQEAPFLPKIWSISAWKLALPGDLTKNSKTCLDSQVFFWGLGFGDVFFVLLVPTCSEPSDPAVSRCFLSDKSADLHEASRSAQVRSLEIHWPWEHPGWGGDLQMSMDYVDGLWIDRMPNFLHVNQSKYEVSHGKPNDPNHSILKWFIINI